MSFLCYVLTLTPSVNSFAELPATLLSELGCHVGIHFKRVGFELYVCLVAGWTTPVCDYGTTLSIADEFDVPKRSIQSVVNVCIVFFHMVSTSIQILYKPVL